MAWTIFLWCALTAGLAALGWGLSATMTGGWNGFTVTMDWLVFVLPPASLVALCVLCGMALRAEIRWTAVAMLVVFLSSAQFAILVCDSGGRFNIVLLPAALCALSVFGLSPRPVLDRLTQSAPWLAALGLLLLGVAWAQRWLERR